MINATKKNGLLFALCILGLVAFGVLTNEISDIKQENKETQAFETIAPQFYTLCLEGVDKNDHLKVLGTLRDCVHKNSVHNMDEEFYANWKNPAYQKLQRVLDYAQGTLKSPPHMECSTRVEVLKGVYDSLGYKTKTIVSAKPVDQYPDHVIISVLNPDTNQYELHDPSHNVSYNDIRTAQRLDSVGVLQTPFENIGYCNDVGLCTQKQFTNGQKIYGDILNLYMGLFYYRPPSGNKNGVLSVNRGRFDPDKARLVDGVLKEYCQKRQKHCHNPIQFYSEQP